jgi:hypothetical protein
MNYKYEIGQTVKATYDRKGIIIKLYISETRNCKLQNPAYELKDGRRRYVVQEGDITEILN